MEQYFSFFLKEVLSSQSEKHLKNETISYKLLNVWSFPTEFPLKSTKDIKCYNSYQTISCNTKKSYQPFTNTTNPPLTPTTIHLFTLRQSPKAIQHQKILKMSPSCTKLLWQSIKSKLAGKSLILTSKPFHQLSSSKITNSFSNTSMSIFCRSNKCRESLKLKLLKERSHNGTRISSKSMMCWTNSTSSKALGNIWRWFWIVEIMRLSCRKREKSFKLSMEFGRAWWSSSGEKEMLSSVVYKKIFWIFWKKVMRNKKLWREN